jgi:NhaP-type Na+/H+ or K+/H+ antiporter
LGILAGSFQDFWLKNIYNDFVLEINLTIVFSYLIFYVAETLKTSGILALVALGLYMSAYG